MRFSTRIFMALALLILIAPMAGAATDIGWPEAVEVSGSEIEGRNLRRTTQRTW